MEFHMMNIIYAALSISAQTEKTTFSCKDDGTLTKHTGPCTYSARNFEIPLCHTPPLRSFFYCPSLSFLQMSQNLGVFQLGACPTGCLFKLSNQTLTKLRVLFAASLYYTGFYLTICVQSHMFVKTDDWETA